MTIFLPAHSLEVVCQLLLLNRERRLVEVLTLFENGALCLFSRLCGQHFALKSLLPIVNCIPNGTAWVLFVALEARNCVITKSEVCLPLLSGKSLGRLLNR